MKSPAGYGFRGVEIPDYMAEGLLAYIEEGRPPGDFLWAVLSNDLMGALGRADDTNIHCLPAYAGYLYNEAPSQCYGSPAKVEAWLKRKAEERESKS